MCNESTPTYYVVTKDAAGNDRVFAGCDLFVAKWTLIPERMVRFTSLSHAITVGSQFGNYRIVATRRDAMGPRVVTSGAPDYLQIIP